MRKILNISLPQSLADYVEKSVKKGKYASKSEFIRDLLRQHSQSETTRQVLKSSTQMKKGLKFPLHSFKDLKKL